jgi:Flp pilus assembly protein TadG
MGITVVAVIGGLATSIKMSDVHRKQASAGSAVRAWAEAVENYATTQYIGCAAANAYRPSVVGYSSLPTGYTTNQTAATSWNGSSWGSCATDNGYQRIILTVTSPDGGVTERLGVVLRLPCQTLPLDSRCT